MAVKIKYDGAEPFDGLPLPFVERSVEYIADNSNTSAVEKIVLTGQIPPSDDNCNRFDYFIAEQSSILSYFAKAYKKFEIIEDGVPIVSRENVRIESIDFSDSNYQSILEYSINLSVFRGDFMKYSGVTDVSNTIAYAEKEDKSLAITHTVSARGVRDSSSASSTTALEKAKAFVESEISRQKIDVAPVFMSHEKVSDDEAPMTPTVTQTSFLETIEPVLTSFSENINRLSGEYSVTNEYVSDLYFYSNGVLRYSVDIDASPDGYNGVNLSGTVLYEEDLGGSANFDLLVDRFQSFDFFGAAKRLSGVSGLNKIPINRSVSRDPDRNTISFDFSFDDNPKFFDANGVERILSFDFSNESNFITINVEGEMRGRLGVKNRWEIAKAEFESLNIFNLTSSAYTSYLEDVLGYSSTLMEKMPINTNILSESITYNESDGAVSFSYTFDNFSQTPDNDIFKHFEYNISVAHPTSSFMETKEWGGEWIVQDMAASDRGSKSISGSAIKKAEVTCGAATAAIIDFMNLKTSSTLTETQRQISFDGVSSFSFSFAWSTADSVNMIGESLDGVANTTLIKNDLIDLS
jgi:hypothetical protein